ncbi:MAG TPA: methanogen output domain 1-containing protein [Gaiellaceae bacterium]|nr:methanogen output domain 1-containing protein [Gaiellaceae bacterium]
MDWYLDARDGSAVERLGRELGDYLRRYGAGDSDYAAAGLAFDELVGNVAAHAGGRAWVRLDWSGETARLEVCDDGPGFALPAAPRRGSGLADITRLAGPVEVSREEAGGARVTLELPVRRRSRPGPGPQRARADALPAPEEAAGNGTFGKESFLRALVVQLAREVEREHGPEAAEDAIAQVGSDVGGRMEDEYRRARGIVERLRPEEIGDLYVRLKHAIDGEFRVLEATDERIVLANRRCPFGDVVRRAPGLCRMTSSVFGGIAARNAGAATVQLERRIAVGDPECRVTVWLGEQARGDRFGHRYRSAAEVSAPEPLRVVLAEDYAYLRDPLIDALADASIEVVSHANTPATLLLKVEKYRPDVAIIDFREADTDKGIAVAAEIRERFPGVAVLVLAEHVEVTSARELLGRDAHGVGYLLKDGLAREEFVAAVRRVAAGAAALDPAIVPELVGGGDPLDDLSPRELEVLELLAAGLSNQAIADRLVITKRAVEKHVKGIFRKLQLGAPNGHDRRVLAALAYLKSR